MSDYDGKDTLGVFIGAAVGVAFHPRKGASRRGEYTLQATAAAAHTGTTTISIQVSNDGIGWIEMGTISVTGNSDSDGFASNAEWSHIRAECTAHGDSTNSVTVTLGR